MKQLAYVHEYFNHRRTRKIVGISVGTVITVVMIVMGIITCVKAKNTATGIASSMIAIIFFGVVSLIVAVKNFFDLFDLNGCEQIFNKMTKKMHLEKMITIDLTNFFPDCKEELYCKLLEYYADGKRLKVKLESTDFPNMLNLKFYPTQKEEDAFSVWFKVDDFKDIEHIWRFIKEHIDS